MASCPARLSYSHEISPKGENQEEWNESSNCRNCSGYLRYSDRTRRQQSPGQPGKYMSTVSGECPKIWEFRECLIRTTSSIPALYHTRKKNNLQLRNWFAMQRNSAEGQIYRLIIRVCRVIPNLLCSYTFLCISGHSSKAIIFFFFWSFLLRSFRVT